MNLHRKRYDDGNSNSQYRSSYRNTCARNCINYTDTLTPIELSEIEQSNKVAHLRPAAI